MAISVSIVNDHAIVAAGIRAVLAAYSRRVRVKETHRRATEVDVLLYDPTTDPRGTSADTLLWQNHGRLIATGWDLDSAQVRAAMPIGVEGYISLQVSPDELVDAIERAHRGELEIAAETRGPGATVPGRWLGHEMGLSRRDSQVLVLVCQGLGNAEIAAALSISVNTVKADILATYRKIGATTRSGAVTWGVTNGFATEVHHRTSTPRRTGLRPLDTTSRPGAPVMADECG